jgi:hypothetical protein
MECARGSNMARAARAGRAGEEAGGTGTWRASQPPPAGSSISTSQPRPPTGSGRQRDQREVRKQGGNILHVAKRTNRECGAYLRGIGGLLGQVLLDACSRAAHRTQR